MKACVGVDVLLTSAIQGGERLASLPGRFTPGESAPVPNEQKAEWALQLL